MLDAYTAYENAMEILNMNMKTEIDYVLDEIKTASDEGEFDIMWFSPYPKTIKKLKQLGVQSKMFSWILRNFVEKTKRGE